MRNLISILVHCLVPLILILALVNIIGFWGGVYGGAKYGLGYRDTHKDFRCDWEYPERVYEFFQVGHPIGCFVGYGLVYKVR